MITSVISAVWLYVLAAIGGAVVFFGYTKKVEADGRAKEQAKQAVATAEALRKAGEVRRDVAGAPDDDLDKRMRRWQ